MYFFIHSMNIIRSASGKNEVMFGQLSKVENTDNSYIFLTTGDQHLLYGICVANSELVVVHIVKLESIT